MACSNLKTAVPATVLSISVADEVLVVALITLDLDSPSTKAISHTEIFVFTISQRVTLWLHVSSGRVFTIK